VQENTLGAEVLIGNMNGGLTSIVYHRDTVPLGVNPAPLSFYTNQCMVGTR